MSLHLTTAQPGGASFGAGARDVSGGLRLLSSGVAGGRTANTRVLNHANLVVSFLYTVVLAEMIK
jgi:hypothetical protein